MAIRFTCPSGHRLKVPDEKAGRGMLCPICQESVTVPERSESTTSPPEPPPVDETDLAHPEEPTGQDDLSSLPVSPSVPPVPPRSDVSVSGVVSAVVPKGRDPIPWGVAAALFAVLAYSILPAWGHLRDVPMPFWVRALLGASVLQAVFVVWMLTVRHWAAMAIVTALYALASTGYATIAVLAFVARSNQAIPWGLEPIRSRAAVWSATVLAVYSLATYLAGAATIHRRRDALSETPAKR